MSFSDSKESPSRARLFTSEVTHPHFGKQPTIVGTGVECPDTVSKFESIKPLSGRRPIDQAERVLGGRDVLQEGRPDRGQPWVSKTMGKEKPLLRILGVALLPTLVPIAILLLALPRETSSQHETKEHGNRTAASAWTGDELEIVQDSGPVQEKAAVSTYQVLSNLFITDNVCSFDFDGDGTHENYVRDHWNVFIEIGEGEIVSDSRIDKENPIPFEIPRKTPVFLGFTRNISSALSQGNPGSNYMLLAVDWNEQPLGFTKLLAAYEMEGTAVVRGPIFIGLNLGYDPIGIDPKDIDITADTPKVNDTAYNMELFQVEDDGGEITHIRHMAPNACGLKHHPPPQAS